MKKAEILASLTKMKVGNSYTINLLRLFLKEKQVNDDLSFKDFLFHIQKNYPQIDCTKLFFSPNQMGKNDELFFQYFMKKTSQPIPFGREAGIVLKTEHTIGKPADGIAVRADGTILTSTCFFDYFGNILNDRRSKIILRNPLGKRPTILVREAASALAIMPNGNILSGTCVFDIDGKLQPNNCGIALRSPAGTFIRKLSDDSASALAVRPDGNIISSTCVFNTKGELIEDLCEIVLRDALGKRIQILVKEPATALALLPNGNILSGTAIFNSSGVSLNNCELVLRDPLGNRILKINDHVITSLAVLPNGMVITGECPSKGPSEFIINSRSQITFNKVHLVTKKKPIPEDVQERANLLLIEMAALACLQFLKGRKENLMIGKLPTDVLRIIFAHVFPLPHAKTVTKIIKSETPQGFPDTSDNNIIQSPQSEIFANSIIKLGFFQKSRVAGDNKQSVTAKNKPR